MSILERSFAWPPVELLLTPWLAATAVVLGLMVVLWLISLKIGDVSIVDSFWGPAFVICVWIYYGLGSAASDDGFRLLHAVLVTVWGVRLALHIGSRHWKHGEEDRRYAEMREKAGDAAFRRRSLFTVFFLQGVLVAVISWPLLFAQAAPRTEGPFPLGLHLVGVLGLFVWAIGFFFEAVGDWQLRRFRANPDNEGEVLDSGLWRYTRHPNYFGDAAQWWGFGLLALGSTGGGWTLVSVALMTFFLLKVSGVMLLEKDISERRPEYRRYVETTPVFLPWFPNHGEDSK